MKQFITLALVAFALCGSARAAAPARPNVLFIVIDNVDYDYMGKCYGGSGLTPQMDAIAKQGVTFTRSYAVTPLCVPSRYTCLTGRYASRCHIGGQADAEDDEPGSRCILEPNLPNIASVMRAAGYATGFVGKYHLEVEKSPRYTGKDPSVFSPEADAYLKARNAILTNTIKSRGFDFVADAMDFRSSQFHGIDFENGYHNPEVQVMGALNFIDQSKDKPFFLYMATRLLHLPIDPKLLLKDYEKYGRITEGGLLPEAPKVPMPSRKEIYDIAAKHGKVTAQNAGMVWLDFAVGAVMQRMTDLKLLDNTLVILFSDNNQRGKETLYEGGTRVPLLMMWPKHFAAGTTCDKVVGNVDFVPTILAACDVKPPAGMTLDGRNMLPILTGESTEWRDGLLLENGRTKAVVTDKWKYVALRYPPDVQAKIEEVDRTGKYPKLTPKAETFFEKFKTTLTPEQWKFARNSWRWHTPGNNYMKSIDDFPFQFDPDQLFVISGGIKPQDTKNVATDPANAAVLADMKQKLKDVLAPLDTGFGEFKTVAADPAKAATGEPAKKTRKQERKDERKAK
jgi:arylsulfatase A-like enzyme